MSKLEKPLGFATGSADKHVKVWSLAGELWGDLRIVGEDPVQIWRFPYNWKESQEEERLKLIDVIKEVESEDVKGLQFAEEEPMRVRKKWRDSEIMPKRSLINPEVVAKAKKTSVGEVQEASNTAESELKLRKRKLRDENPGTSLAQDVLALVEQYKKAPEEKRQELQEGMKTLRDRLCTY